MHEDLRERCNILRINQDFVKAAIEFVYDYADFDFELPEDESKEKVRVKLIEK